MAGRKGEDQSDKVNLDPGGKALTDGVGTLRSHWRAGSHPLLLLPFS